MSENIRNHSHGITVIDAHYVQQGVASIYIVAQGDKVSIIETGTNNSVPYILMAVYGEEKYRALYGTLKAIPEHRVIIADDNFKLNFNDRIFH